jgi:hypothetical protein
MGKYIIDKCSIINIIMGIIAFSIGITFETWIILNAIFEIVENVGIIDNYIHFYSYDENVLDSISDVALAGIGWRIGFSISKNLI